MLAVIRSASPRISNVVEGAQDLRRHLPQDGRGGLGVEQHRELLAAQARDDVAGAQGVLDARADGAQERVAGAMAEGVVELLEVVEVEHEHRLAPAAQPRGADRLAGARHEQAAVRERREVVGRGLAAGLGEPAHVVENQREAHERGEQGEDREGEAQRVDAVQVAVHEQAERGGREPGGDGQQPPARQPSRGGRALRLPDRDREHGDGADVEQVLDARGRPRAARDAERVEAVRGAEQRPAAVEVPRSASTATTSEASSRSPIG